MKKLLWILVLIFIFLGLAFFKGILDEEQQPEKLSSYQNSSDLQSAVNE